MRIFNLKWISRLARTVVVVLFLLLQSAPVLSFDYQDVVVVAVPRFGAGILNFRAQQIGDNTLNFTWDYAENVTGIMIRGNYGSYPTDITDESATPSSGFLVYTGNETSYTYNFDENISTLYIKAWGQNNDGLWIVSPDTVRKDSAVTFIAFMILPLVLMGLALGFKRQAIAWASIIPWLVFGFYSRSLSTETWDLYYMLFWLSVLGMPLLCMTEALLLRPKKQEDKQDFYPDEADQMSKDWETLSSPSIPRLRSRGRYKARAEQDR